MKKLICFLFVLLLQSHLSLAQSYVPPSLQEWIPWVKKENPNVDCPMSADKSRRCLWGSVLKLDINSNGGQFEQSWQVLSPSFVPLPGSDVSPPLNVTVNGTSAAQVMVDKISSVYLQKGQYIIKGQFSWKKIPDNLFIDESIGLIRLVVNGKLIANANREIDGVLWLLGDSVEVAADDALELDVYRKIKDGIPLELVTRLDLKVSGQNREIRLDSFLPTGFVPLSLSSPIPAKIESNGGLTLQLRPGEFNVDITSRHPENVTTIEVPQVKSPWPLNEVWVWHPDPKLRQIDLQGVSSVDPSQTSLPTDWKSLAAYQTEAGSKFEFVEKSRGIMAQKANQLTLNRTYWLDFDGSGVSVKDEITGLLYNTYRLEASPEYLLGRVGINGQDQLITSVGNKISGVEIRDPNIAAVAESRIESSFSDITVAGWQADFQSVTANLVLPPGWRLLAAPGVDVAAQSWTSQWTLMDFFLILVVTVGMLKLFGVKEAGLALAALILNYHEKNFFDSIWPIILCFTAITTLIKSDSMWLKFLRLVRVGLILGVVLWMIPYIVNQIKNGLHPVLEKPYLSLQSVGDENEVNNYTRSGLPFMAKDSPPPIDGLLQKNVAEVQLPAPNSVDEPQRLQPSVERSTTSYNKGYYNLKKADPQAKIQTGSGLANWNWHQMPLTWTGPVSKDQKMSLLLLSPVLNATLSFLRVLLLIAFFGTIAGWPMKKVLQGVFTKRNVLLLFIWLLPLTQAQASGFPDAELLGQLRAELEKSPVCFPDCAMIESTHVEINNEALKISMKVNSQRDFMVGLPRSNRWNPQSVRLGEGDVMSFRDAEGVNWILVPEGVHEVVVLGAVDGLTALSLTFPSEPLKVTLALTGWTQTGIDDNGFINGSIELNKQGGVASKEDEVITQDLAPFVKIERDFYFGLDWEVTTRVVRVGQPGVPITLDYPLLPGEYVSGDDPKVSEGRARIILQPQDLDYVWNSRLNISDQLSLAATKNSLWVEVWKIHSAPSWHLELSGLTPVETTDSNEQYLFKPWPGESVNIGITKPVAVAGATMAIDNVNLFLKPGKRSTDAELTMTIRSSLALTHEIIIPEESAIEQVLVNGAEVPLSYAKGRLRLDIRQGSQNITLKWREPTGIGLVYKTPKIDLGVPSVNMATNIDMPQDRWLLGFCGRGYGPVMLFWSYLIVLLLAGFILSKMPINEIKIYQWFLLGLGLTQVSSIEVVFVVAWFVCVSYRKKQLPLNDLVFNLRQIGLVVLTLIMFGILINAIQTGLLGHPQMQISGNLSSNTYLSWFVDRNDKQLAVFSVYSVSLWIYRMMMLVWALWLANSCIRWVKWAWQAFTEGGAWRKFTSIVKK